MHAHEMGIGAERRLESDLRTFSPAGVEPVAWGWRRHEDHPETFHVARAGGLALDRAEQSRRRVGRFPFAAPGPDGGVVVAALLEGGTLHEAHTAERAVYGAALALFVGDRLPHTEYVALVRRSRRRCPGCCPRRRPPRVMAEGMAVARLARGRATID